MKPTSKLRTNLNRNSGCTPPPLPERWVRSVPPARKVMATIWDSIKVERHGMLWEGNLVPSGQCTSTICCADGCHPFLGLVLIRCHTIGLSPIPKIEKGLSGVRLVLDDQSSKGIRVLDHHWATCVDIGGEYVVKYYFTDIRHFLLRQAKKRLRHPSYCIQCAF